MGKVLKTAVIVGAVFAITVATGGIGAGFVGAATATLGGAAAAAGIGLSAVAAAAIAGGLVGTALGIATSLLAPSADLSAATDRLNASLDPQAFGKWVFGETIGATDLLYSDNAGTKNKFITQVFHVASHKVESIGELWIDDELAVNAAGTVQAAWSGVMTYGKKLGTDPQTAFGIANSFWPTTATGNGLALFYIQWDLKGGEDKLSGGLPTRLTQKIKGAPVYDPRLDTSVGGSGSHRANDQSTWQYSAGGVDIGANWALCVLHYLIGYRTAAGKLVYGVGADPATEIDYDSFMAAANVCDEIVDSKPRYRIGGIIPTTQEHDKIITELEAAINGKVSKIGGKYFVWAPNDDLISAGTITDDDIVREAGVVFDPSGPIEELYNTVRGRFIDPSLQYQPNQYPEVVESAAVIEDGRERVKDHDFAMIQDVEIAQRVARQILRRSRFSGRWRFAMGPKGLLFKPFAVITLNIQETNNTDQLVRIVNMGLSATGIVALDVVEEDASIYNTTAALGTAVTQLDPSSFNPATKIDVTGLAASDVSVAGSGGTARDALKVTWDDPGGFARSTEVQFRVKGTTDWESAETQRLDFTSVLIVGVNPSTIYEVRARHISIIGVAGDWTAAVEETTGATETAASAANVPFDNVTGPNKPEDNADVTGSRINGLVNGGFETGTSEGWAAITGSIVPGGHGGNFMVRLASAPGGPNALSKLIPTRPNERWLLTGWAQRDATSVPNANAGLFVRWYDGAKAAIGSPVLVQTAIQGNAAWQGLRGVVKAPANAEFIQLDFGESAGTTGHWLGDDFDMVKVPANADIDALETTNGPAEPGADVTSGKPIGSLSGVGALATLDTVNTQQLVAKAVTNSFFAELASDQALSTSSTFYQEITGLQLSFTSSADAETTLLFMVTITIHAAINDDDRWRYNLKVTRDAATIHERLGAFQVPPKDITTTPASESHTLSAMFEVSATGVSNIYEFFISLTNNEIAGSREGPQGGLLEASAGSTVLVLERQR